MEPMKLDIQMFATPDPVLQADCHFRFINVSNPPTQIDITFYRETDSTIVTVDFTNGEFEGKCGIGFPIKKIIVGDGTLYSATWVENLSETLDVYIYPKNTITGKILGDNVDNITAYSTYGSVSNNNRPNFSNAATTDEGMFADFDNDGVTTYFRGATTNNYVKFANFWWRIIRVNGNGSVRLIYDGTTAHANGESSTDRQIGTSAFNTNINDNAYVGYMYGTLGGTTYEATHANVNNSAVKTTLDNWYESNLSNYSDYIDTEAGFWGDRTPYSGSGTGTTQTYYAAYNRLYTNKTPSFKCTSNSDLYTTTESKDGNKALQYPIGLISADEVAYAGGVYNTSNSSYYLYISGTYWTMSPYRADSDGWAYVFRVDSDGYLYYNGVNNPRGVRPVINLRGDLSVTGTGTSTDPYEVSLPAVPTTNFNGTELTNIYYNGTEISKMYYNGVLVFEKGPTVYKRRIMEDDNLNGKTIYFDFPNDYNLDRDTTEWNFVVMCNSNFMIYDQVQQEKTYVKIEGTYSFDTIYDPDQNINLKEYHINENIPVSLNVSSVTECESYRHCYIEDPNIRPLQIGDTLNDNTKIYFTFPDNYEVGSASDTGRYIYWTGGLFQINVTLSNTGLRISATSYLSSEETITIYNMGQGTNKSVLDLTEFTEGATITGTIMNTTYVPPEIMEHILVDTTTLVSESGG